MAFSGINIMASPQIENGYTKIANEIMENLSKLKISGQEWQIIITLFRKTYGFNKKKDSISLSQFVENTGLAKPRICESIKSLINKNIVTQKRNGKVVNYSFQKDYTKWKSLRKNVTLRKNVIGVTLKRNNRYVKTYPQKKVLKETITKEKKKSNKRKIFIQPTLEELKIFITENNYNIDSEYFLDHYNSNGWCVGKNKMKDWKATIRNWNRRDYQKQSSQETGVPLTTEEQIRERDKK